MMNSVSVRTILERLVSFRMVSSESHFDLIEWAGQYLAAIGIDSARVFNPGEGKAYPFTMIRSVHAGQRRNFGKTVDGRQWYACNVERNRNRTIREHGYQDLVCGPGDVITAHKSDGRIGVSQLEAAEGFMQD